MKRLVELFLRRPVFTWVLVLGVVVLGLTGLAKMPIERFPNIDIAYVTVTIQAPGLSAEQVETEIAQRVEGAIGTVGGLDRIDATCSEGVAVVTAQFTVEKSSTEAANDIRDRVARLADELPPTARPARIETFNLNTMPVLLVGVTAKADGRTPVEVGPPSLATLAVANGRTLSELTEYADVRLRRELQSVPGVGEARLVGGERRTLSIVLEPEKLAALALTPLDVKRALAVENLEAPGGKLPDGENDVGVRLAGKARSAQELEEVVIARRGAVTIRLKDLGRVEDAGVPSDSRASVSGNPAVILAVMKQPGANTVAVVDEVLARVKSADATRPDGIDVRVIQDNSADIRASLSAVTEHLVIGAILAAAVVLLFLRSVRATLIAAIAIPASIIGTFAVARALGLTLNMLSLLGLTLAVGIVIDDAIVVLENIVHVMQKKKLSAREATAEATQEIGLAVLATTLSLVAVFLPVATMDGIVGRYLAPFSLTMSASILISMAIAFSLTPLLSSRWLGKKELAHAASDAGGGRLEVLYTQALAWMFRRKWVAGVAIVATLASIVPILTVLPTTFLPTEDNARYSVYVRLPESVSVEKTADVAESIATLARTLPDVTETAVTTMSSRDASVTVTLGRRGVQDARVVETRKRLDERFGKAGYLMMVAPIQEGAAGPEAASIQFVLRGGKDYRELTQTAAALLEASRTVPGTVDHGISSGGGAPELAVAVDRARARALGVSHADLGETLAMLDRVGIDLGSIPSVNAGELPVPVRLRIAAEGQRHLDTVRALTVRSEGGSIVPLASVGSVTEKEGPGIVRRTAREREVTLFMNTTPGTSDGAVLEALTKKLASVSPGGLVRGEVIGNAKEMEKALSAFLLAIGLSFVFMYLVLAAQFESWKHPVTILLSLPLTVPFGLVSLLLGGQSLNLFSMLGFLVLFGVVKKNAILQVDRAISLRNEGRTAEEAMLAAARDRLRPILMTTLAFVAGMIPLIVSSSAGAATNRAIGVGILGGQTLSLGLTLLVTPVVYVWFDALGRKKAVAAPPPVNEEPPTALPA
jgi:hydrophobe/amphiphile efflux-1 (HAE1) family protein